MGQIDVNKLWQNFLDKVQNHYMDFAGRVGRAQYWWFVLVCFLVILAAAIIDGVVRTTLLAALVELALLLPMAGMTARRLQDGGTNGQIVWLWVIVGAINGIIGVLMGLSGPFGVVGFFWFFISIGWLINLAGLVITIVLIYFCVQPGASGDNAYGPAPAPWTPNATPA